MTEETQPTTALSGRAAAEIVARYGETKANLETALRATHYAMALTPWFEQVEPLADVGNTLAMVLAAHADLFKQATMPRPTTGGTDG